ncbi:MAG: hypothetical protein JO128_24080 [Alphaproteobacteria bacterium]|nr:hypothetical protein [Alphaproteobacteria bacterium]
MADKLLSPHQLRAHARRHREAAMAMDDPKRRKQHLVLAEEYESLAKASEAERAWVRSTGPVLTPRTIS